MAPPITQPINYLHRQRHKSFTSSQSTTPYSTTNHTKHSTIKKQIRDLERLLQKNTKLPESVRNAKAAEIQDLKHQLQHQKHAKKEAKYKRKYKQIKFYDWRKADRKLQQLRKKLFSLVPAENNDDMSIEERELRRQIAAVEDDLLYINNYPTDKKYISLYAKFDGDDVAEADRKKHQDSIEEVRKTIFKRHKRKEINDDDFQDSTSHVVNASRHKRKRPVGETASPVLRSATSESSGDES